jgi:uncharacterized protein (TIGR03437 family)
MNPRFYSLAAENPSAFHDVTSGDNMINVVCTTRTRNCTPGTIGFAATTGYDQATGLGSVDVNKLITSWRPAAGGAPAGTPAISGIANGASFAARFAPGGVVTVFGSQLSQVSLSANTLPLPLSFGGVSVTVNGIGAPLYYVSPGQINLQLPYETLPNSTAVLQVNNNGQTASSSFLVSASAPGVFTDASGAAVPFARAARGQTVTLYITGAGAVTPNIGTGAAPATGAALSALPKPAQPVTITVGAVPATVQFAAIPWGLVGVMQINYTVPTGVSPGTRSVVVSIGGASSNPATLQVTQ